MGLWTPKYGDAIEVGGVTLTQLSKLIVLGGVQEALGSVYSSLRAPNTNAAYVVPASKKLVAKAIQVSCPNGGNSIIYLGYADNDVGFGVVTVPTNPVAFYKTATANGTSFGASTAAAVQSYALPAFEIPAGKYAFGATVVWTGVPTNTAYQVFYYLENV